MDMDLPCAGLDGSQGTRKAKGGMDHLLSTDPNTEETLDEAHNRMEGAGRARRKKMSATTAGSQAITLGSAGAEDLRGGTNPRGTPSIATFATGRDMGPGHAR